MYTTSLNVVNVTVGMVPFHAFTVKICVVDFEILYVGVFEGL